MEDIEKSKSVNHSKFMLTWEDVDLKIRVNRGGMCGKDVKELQVLKGISGYAESGECLAIMGGSGAGKSTLLNILSGRFRVESNMDYSGKVMLNGQPMDWGKYKKIFGFVM